MNMIQNTLISMIGIGVTAMVAGVAVSTYKHYYERYADLEDLKNIGVLLDSDILRTLCRPRRSEEYRSPRGRFGFRNY